MCLTANVSATARCYNRHAEYRICYKQLSVVGYDLISRYQYMKYYPGWNKSNIRGHTQLVKLQKYINKGIHVYTKKPTNSSFLCTVPIRCYKKDLIAVDNYGEAVYRKVFLTETSYKKALKWTPSS